MYLQIVSKEQLTFNYWISDQTVVNSNALDLRILN